MWTGEAPSTGACHGHDRTMRRIRLPRPVFPLEGGAIIERHVPAPELGRKESAPGVAALTASRSCRYGARKMVRTRAIGAQARSTWCQRDNRGKVRIPGRRLTRKTVFRNSRWVGGLFR